MIPQISAPQAWQMLLDDDSAVLVDVRTETEWRTIGVADAEASGRPARFVAWTDEQGSANPHFADVVTDGLDPDTPILLLCRSGGRSQAAAELLASMGYSRCHNIVGGFEGPRGPDGTHAGGWKDSVNSTTWSQ